MFGCGKGGLLSVIRINTRSFDLVGIDISINMLKEARLNGTDSCIQADALHLPIRGEVVDIVISSEVIEHIIDPTKFLKELKRVSKPHGFIMVTFPNCIAYYFLLCPLLKFLPIDVKRKLPKLLRRSIPYEDPSKTEQPIDNAYTSTQVMKWLNRLNFKITNMSSEMQTSRLSELKTHRSLRARVLEFLPVIFHYRFFILAQK